MRSDLTPWTIRGVGLALGALLVIGLVALGIAAGGVVLLVFIAVLLASALEPGSVPRASAFSVGRGSTILLVYVGFFVSVIGLAFVVVPAAIEQAEDLIVALPPFFEEAERWAADLRPAALSSSVSALIASVATVLRPPPPPDPDTVVEVGTVVAEAAVTLATLLTIVYLLARRARPAPALRPGLPAGRTTRRALAMPGTRSRAGSGCGSGASSSSWPRWVSRRASPTPSWVCPGALLLAIIAALTEAIPIVGPLLGAIPAVLVAATVSPELAVIVAVIYVVLQFIEGTVLVPMVMRNTVGISPLLDPRQPAHRRGRRRARRRVPGRPGRRVHRDRPVPAPGPRGPGRPGPGGRRDTRRGGRRGPSSVATGRRRRDGRLTWRHRVTM